MIEVMVIETMNGEQSHQVELEQYLNTGYDLYSNHVTYNSEFHCMIYTSFLTRGSRPGTLNKASVIEAMENKLKALEAELTALQLQIKAVDQRLDLTIKDFHGGDDEEAVPNDWLQMQIQEARNRGSWSTSPEELDVYTQVVEEAIAEDMENNR